MPDEIATGGATPDTAAAAAPTPAESTTPPEATAEGAATEAAPNEDAVAAAKQAASTAGKQLSEAQKAERAARFRDMDRKRHDAERRAETLARENADLKARLKTPDPAQYDDVTKYQADQLAHTLDKRDADRLEASSKTANQEAEAVVAEVWQERVAAFKETAIDFDEVALKAPISDASARDIARMEEGPQIAYYLGKHPAEARALNNLSERDRAVQLGRLAGRLTTTPPRKISTAPTPVDAVAGKGAQTSSFDPSKASMEEYAAKRKAGWKG